MSDCTHDCSTCGESCGGSQRTTIAFQIKPLREGCRVGKVYGVVSGKGGVGKSMVTSQLAVTMRRRGYNVAVLDADITGPSIPKAFGIHGRAMGTGTRIVPVETPHRHPDDVREPAAGERDRPRHLARPRHRRRGHSSSGPTCLWNDVDYMFVDMPPGTGDVALNVFQSLPVDGVIIVAVAAGPGVHGGAKRP